MPEHYVKNPYNNNIGASLSVGLYAAFTYVAASNSDVVNPKKESSGSQS